MPLNIDVHDHVEGLPPEAVAEAHRMDLEIQEAHGVTYHRYWLDTESGKVFCLVDAPSKEATEKRTVWWPIISMRSVKERSSFLTQTNA